MHKEGNGCDKILTSKKRVTYKSEVRETQVDYILCRRCNLKEIGGCKVVTGVSVARQHQMAVRNDEQNKDRTKNQMVEAEKGRAL